MPVEFLDARPLYMSRLAWDIAQHEDMGAILSALGVVPPSAESFEKEHADSHMRMALVENYRQKVEWLSQIAACICTCLILDKSGDENDDDDEPPSEEERGESIEALTEIIAASTMAILATLIYDQLTQKGFNLE